jgi:acetyltransferase-like isoleucine patch superfamily enzyme
MILYVWAKIWKKIRGTAIKNSTIHPSSKIESGSLIVNSRMDKHSFCGYDCRILNCSIGSFCSLASNVVIGGGMHPIKWISTSPAFYEGRDSIKAKFSEHERERVQRVQIGHDVWIGENVMIKQGVTIGTGAVIGMGSIVTRDVEPYMIVAGNPARVIRPRFDKELAEELLAAEWWRLDEEVLRNLGQYAKEPQAFLAKIKE